MGEEGLKEMARDCQTGFGLKQMMSTYLFICLFILRPTNTPHTHTLSEIEMEDSCLSARLISELAANLTA